jgi:elongation factor P--(R)-beta-lysine ligase
LAKQWHAWQKPVNNSLDWQPSATLETLSVRAAMLAATRQFFSVRKVLEVETPVLCAHGVTDPHIANISVSAGETARWLRTSPEYHMKRLLAAGAGDIYQIGKVFRDGEAGRIHQPEFTMIEWYRHGFSTEEMAQDTCDLIIELSAYSNHPVVNTERISYREAFIRSSGLDPFTASSKELRAAAARHSVSLTMIADHEDRSLWLDLLAGTIVYPSLTGNKLWVVDRFPADQAMLARLNPADPTVAERFEVFLHGVELANGFRELRDPVEQAARFTTDRKRREWAGKPDILPDSHLLAALEAGLPDCAGVAVGLDRVLLVTNQLRELRATMSFAPVA